MMKSPPKKRQRCLYRSAKLIDFSSSLLSEELLLHIFSYLSAADLIRCQLVNSYWSRLANDAMLWKPLFYCRFTDFPQEKIIKRKNINWKLKYKINHNWQSGNCQISSFKVFDRATLATSERSRQRQRVQFDENMLCIADTNHSFVKVWRFTDGDRVPKFCGDLLLETTSRISCIRLESKGSPTGQTCLVVGLENGGFSIWKLDVTSPSLKAEEVVEYRPLSSKSHRTDQSVEAIALSYPMIVICTKNMKLLAFLIEETPIPTLHFVHQLQSPIRWRPIIIQLCPYPSIVTRNGTRDRVWKATIAFGMAVGVSSYSIGAQEIIFSQQAILLSRHCSALNQDRVFFAVPEQGRQVSDFLQPMTDLAYSEPFLTTAHANNTIKQYRLVSTPERLDIVYVRTLYGHTCKVAALALNAAAGKLVSGDRSGLKIWNLSSLDRPKNGTHDTPMASRRRYSGSDYLVGLAHYPDQRRMKELPPLDINWLHFDQEKIVALIQEEHQVSLKTWSFL